MPLGPQTNVVFEPNVVVGNERPNNYRFYNPRDGALSIRGSGWRPTVAGSHLLPITNPPVNYAGERVSPRI